MNEKNIAFKTATKCRRCLEINLPKDVKGLCERTRTVAKEQKGVHR